MEFKRIVNVVFYKFFGENGEMEQACIFYNDGTVKNCSYEDGIDAAEEIVRQEQITSKNAFAEMINSKRVYVMSGREFEDKFQSFIVNEEPELKPVVKQKKMVPAPLFDKKAIYNGENSSKENFTANNNANDNANYNVLPLMNEHEEKTIIGNQDDISRDSQDEKVDKVETATDIDLEEEQFKNTDPIDFDSDPVSIDVVDFAEENTQNNTNNEDENQFSGENLDNDANNNDNNSKFVNPNNENKTIKKPSLEDLRGSAFNNEVLEAELPGVDTNVEEFFDEDELMDGSELEDDDDFFYTEDLDDEEVLEEEKEKTPKSVVKTAAEAENGKKSKDKKDSKKSKKAKKTKKDNWFKRVGRKAKILLKKFGVKLTALGLVLGLGCTAYSCTNHKTKEGQMLRSNITSEQSFDDLTAVADENLVYGNNDEYDNYTYKQLLIVNDQEQQKNSMRKVGNRLSSFNHKFANNYVEEGKNVKAALTFDEMVALHVAYNDYTDEELKAIFNGAHIKSADLSAAYKNAVLQVMGGHIIETPEHPLDMSTLLNTNEGKEFYKKYRQKYLEIFAAKTEEEKIARVGEFYDYVLNDFPITEEIREVGISHADGRKSLEPYKLAVVPMISATEMMYQNLGIDKTLNDKLIDYFNDLGLCNYAEETFDKIERLTENSVEDNAQPLYEQYKEAKIRELKEIGAYVIDDKHRDLSQLDAFQNRVNWHFGIIDGQFETDNWFKTTTSTRTETSTKTWTETTKKTTSNRDEAVREAGEDAVKKAEEEADREIERENEEEKKKAEEEANKKQEEMQKEEDKKKEELEDEVDKSDDKLDEDIKDANDQIDDNNKDQDTSNDTPVNEDDFGDANVDFDDEDSNDNGDLDDSVEDITKDPEDVKDPSDLPDPDETGKDFDNNGGNNGNSGSNDNSDADIVTPPSSEGSSYDEPEYVPVENDSNQNIIEYEEEVVETPETAAAMTNEELVNAYVEGLANQQETAEDSYQYVK